MVYVMVAVSLTNTPLKETRQTTNESRQYSKGLEGRDGMPLGVPESHVFHSYEQFPF